MEAPIIETLGRNVIALSSSDGHIGLHDVSVELSAYDAPAGTLVDVVGNVDYESGVFKVLSGDGIFYNQLDIDPYSCTLVSAFTSLSNMTGKVVSIETMRKAFNAYVDSGKFTHGYGGLMTDGADFAVKAFNEAFGTNIKWTLIAFTTSNCIDSLKQDSPFNVILKYGRNFASNEQSDGVIQNDVGVTGNNGHCVSFVKVNTTDSEIGVQMKYVENYHGVVAYDIIYVRPGDYPALFGSNIVTYSV